MLMIVLFVITGVICCGYVVSASSTHATITKVIIFSFTDWIFSHIVISGLLFWVNIYSIKKCVFSVMVFWGIIAFICVAKKKRPSISFDIREERMAFIVVFVTLPLLFTKFEFFGMGQDEGVYQTQAILFINGITDINVDLEELYTLESEEEIEKFVEATSTPNLNGFYRYLNRTELPGIQAKNVSNENLGAFHGIPTFSALLALWGKMFGMENMQGINTVMYICILFIIFYICKEISLKGIGLFTALFIYAISPLVIWTNKSALTETTFTLIFVSYLYCILKSKKREMKYAILSALCIFTLGYFHVSIYAFMPLFVLLYLFMWLFYQRREYLYAMILTVLGYITGFWMMYTVSTQYTSDNYRFIYYAFINSSILCQLVTVISILVILFGITLLHCKKSFLVSGISALRFSICYKVIYVVFVIIAIYRCVLEGMNNQQIPNITLVAYAIVTGIIIMTLVYLSTFFNTKWWLNSFQKCLMLVVFTYCILAYSAIFKNWIYHYYYYARYLTMFIPIISIMGGIILNRVKAWKGILAVALSALILLPFDLCLMTEQDDSRIEWETLVSIAEEIDTNDSVIITNNSLFDYFYFTLKAMTGANIYPVLNEDLSEQISSLAEISENVYVLSENELEIEANSVSLMVDIKIKNNRSQDSNSLDDDYLNPNHQNLLQLPLTFNKSIQTFILYKLE